MRHCRATTEDEFGNIRRRTINKAEFPRYKSYQLIFNAVRVWRNINVRQSLYAIKRFCFSTYPKVFCVQNYSWNQLRYILLWTKFPTTFFFHLLYTPRCISWFFFIFELLVKPSLLTIERGTPDARVVTSIIQSHTCPHPRGNLAQVRGLGRRAHARFFIGRVLLTQQPHVRRFHFGWTWRLQTNKTNYKNQHGI